MTFLIDIIWFSMILIAIVFSIVNNTEAETVAAISSGAKTAINLSLIMMGNMAFWLGITKISDKAGISRMINKLLIPINKKLFPEYKSSDEVMEKISMNMTANLLGLSNAATPLGLEAMRLMDRDRTEPSAAVILFVVINTTSLQIIPTQIAALRSAYGSESAFGIMPYVWICSFISLVMCIIFCKLIERVKRCRK